MIVVERTFAVTAAPGVVLGYLEDFANAQEWDPSAERTSRIGGGPIAPGAQWRHARKFFWVTAELTYTLLESGAGRIVLQGRSEGATCVDTITVRAVPGGTEVTYRVEWEMHGLAKLTTPIMRSAFERLATDSVAAVTAALGGVQPRRFGAATPNLLPTPAEETG